MEKKKENKRREGVSNSTAIRRKLFSEYVEPNLNLVYSSCVKYSKNKSDIDDNYQECLINLFKGIHTYNSDFGIATWIHTVSRRAIVQMDNKNSESENLMVEQSNEHNTFIDESGVVITESNYMNTLSDEMVEALENLSPKVREAFIKKHLFGYSLKDIVKSAKANDMLASGSIDTIKSRIHLAKKSLNKTING